MTRRRLLHGGAALAAAGALGSTAGPRALGRSMVVLSGSSSRVLYRHAAVVDGRSATRALDRSVLVENGRVAWIRPSDSEPDPGSASGLTIVDARGLTIVPGLVDGHCHLTSPGGPDYMQRFKDSPSVLLETAERNGSLARQAGIAWLREMGSRTAVDPVDGRRRAISLGIRDRWQGRTDRPRVRAAGTWICAPGGLEPGLGIVVRNGDELLAAAMKQLDQGANLVKLYVEAKDSRDSPWTPMEIRRVVDAARARGARVGAHAMWLLAARAAVFGGVSAIDHGFNLDADVCAEMRRRGTYLVTTLTVPRNWLRMGQTTSGTWWSTRAGKRYARRLLEKGNSSVDIARRAGVKIAAGSDFGGGSTRAGQLAWEVESLVTAGLEPWQAIGAATWRGGDLLGVTNAGRIVEGGPADFFLVDGDPYSDPSSLWNVRRLA
jgi:imidazolonepropionase-like amidohydrolase